MTDSQPHDASRRGKASGSPPRTDGPHDSPSYASECYACPIGTVFMTLQDARPEATDHLVRAGRELLAAMRTLLEGAWGYLDEIDRRRGAAPIERIPVRRNGPPDA